MRRTLATAAAALALTAGAAAPALADPVYPPTTPPQIEPSVVPTSSAPVGGAVVQNRAAASPSALAFTGAETATLAGGAALLVVGGAFLVRSARKRGSHTA